jgi:hypothetical protein
MCGIYGLQSMFVNADRGSERSAANGRGMRMRRAMMYIGKQPSIMCPEIILIAVPSIVFPRGMSLMMAKGTAVRKVTTGIAAITREPDRHIHISAAVGK